MHGGYLRVYTDDMLYFWVQIIHDIASFIFVQSAFSLGSFLGWLPHPCEILHECRDFGLCSCDCCSCCCCCHFKLSWHSVTQMLCCRRSDSSLGGSSFSGLSTLLCWSFVQSPPTLLIFAALGVRHEVCQSEASKCALQYWAPYPWFIAFSFINNIRISFRKHVAGFWWDCDK